jgi:ATP-dependent 26S proteasome regulatory subunit
LVAQLIAQLDFNKGFNGSVFALATTNAIEGVDPALLQARQIGRSDSGGAAE